MVIRIDERDPLAILLVRVLRLSTWKTVLLVFLSFSFVEGVIFYPIDGMWASPRDWPWLVREYLWFFLEIPVIYWYYRWSIDNIPLLFTTLESIGVVRKARRGQVRAFFDQLQERFNHWGCVVLTVVLALACLAWVNRAWSFSPPPWFQAGNRFHRLFAMAAVLLTAYVVVTVALREVLTIVWIRRFFRDFEIRILPRPQHRAGGFGVLGHHYLRLSYFFIALGMYLGMDPLIYLVQRRQLPPAALTSQLLLLPYLVLSIVSFLLPSWIAHRSMVAERERVLAHIFSAYEQDIRRLSDGIGPTAGDINQVVQALQCWRNAYDLTMSNLPTWPWETEGFAKLRAVVASVIPLGLGIVSLILRMAAKK